MTHALMALCGASVMGYTTGDPDWRFGFFVFAVLSGFSAIALVTMGIV